MPLANKSSQTRIGSRGHITHLPGNILPRFGNLKVRIFQESFDGGPSDAVQTRDSNSVIDAVGRLDMTRLEPDFDHLLADPYVKEGFRRKHLAWFLHRGRTASTKGLSGRFERLPQMPLFQSAAYNPTHGDLARSYPELIPSDREAMLTLLSLFADQSEMPIGETVLLQYQRVTCKPDLKGEPSVEGWHRDGVTRIGICCIARDGIEGGQNLFRVHDSGDDDVLEIDLQPGQMAVFDDEPVRHRVTPIQVAGGRAGGHRDVVLMSYGGKLTA